MAAGGRRVPPLAAAARSGPRVWSMRLTARPRPEEAPSDCLRGSSGLSGGQSGGGSRLHSRCTCWAAAAAATGGLSCAGWGGGCSGWSSGADSGRWAVRESDWNRPSRPVGCGVGCGGFLLRSRGPAKPCSGAAAGRGPQAGGCPEMQSPQNQVLLQAMERHLGKYLGQRVAVQELERRPGGLGAAILGSEIAAQLVRRLGHRGGAQLLRGLAFNHCSALCPTCSQHRAAAALLPQGRSVRELWQCAGERRFKEWGEW